MPSILDIRVQKLFLIVLILKVGSSALGWYLQRPWSLGLVVPIVLMGGYILLGYFRRDTDVTDEKFADTCYYLGFIFTITSIIFCLLDLPSIGTRIQDIAVRFGAAMISTVLGLAVRVYLVSFKKDVGDAIKDAEDAVLDATAKFTEQLKVSLERLRDFESQVDVGARSTVERVNLQVESLAKNYADKLTDFFGDLTKRNQEAFTEALGKVDGASNRLANVVDAYSLGMRQNLSSIEAKVTAFAEAVSDRLKTTTFPDDYFIKHLAAPLAQLEEAATEVAGQVRNVSAEVRDSTVVLGRALKKLRDKADVTEGSLDIVLELTKQQQAVLDASQEHLTVMGRLTTAISAVDSALANTLSAANASNATTSELAARVSALTAEGSESRKSLEGSLATVVARLDANATATELVATGLAAAAAARQGLTEKFVEAAAASDRAAGKLDAAATADVESAKVLEQVGARSSAVVERVGDAVGQLHEMVRQLTFLDSALRAQGSDLKLVAERLTDIRVELPTQGIHDAVSNAVRPVVEAMAAQMAGYSGLPVPAVMEFAGDPSSRRAAADNPDGASVPGRIGGADVLGSAAPPRQPVSNFNA